MTTTNPIAEYAGGVPSTVPSWPDDMSFAAPPIFGDARAQIRHALDVEEALEAQRLARIQTAVAPRCSVTVGDRVFGPGNKISLAACNGEVTFWAKLLERRVVLQVDPRVMPIACEHGPSHVFVVKFGLHGLGERVCWRCFHKEHQAAVPEVPARLTWDGVIIKGKQSEPEVHAVDGRKVIEDFVARGKLRELAKGE